VRWVTSLNSKYKVRCLSLPEAFLCEACLLNVQLLDKNKFLVYHTLELWDTLLRKDYIAMSQLGGVLSPFGERFCVCIKWAWVDWIGAERVAGSRTPHSAALVFKAGVAAVRGRVGTGWRLDTQTQCFTPGHIQLRTPCYTNTYTHNQAQSLSVLFSFPFYTAHLSVRHAAFSISHPAVFPSLSKCLRPSLAVVFQPWLLKKIKSIRCLLWCTSTIILFPINPPCHPFQPQFIWFSLSPWEI